MVANINANDKNTKKSNAVGYGTFGKSVRASKPKNVIVKTVVMPSDTRSAVASRFNQNDTHDSTTNSTHGP